MNNDEILFRLLVMHTYNPDIIFLFNSLSTKSEFFSEIKVYILDDDDRCFLLANIARASFTAGRQRRDARRLLILFVQ